MKDENMDTAHIASGMTISLGGVMKLREKDNSTITVENIIKMYKKLQETRQETIPLSQWMSVPEKRILDKYLNSVKKKAP